MRRGADALLCRPLPSPGRSPGSLGPVGRSDSPPLHTAALVSLAGGAPDRRPGRRWGLPGSVRLPSLRADGWGPGGGGSALALASGRGCLPRRSIRVGLHGVGDFGAGPVHARILRISAHRVPVYASSGRSPGQTQDSVPATGWLARRRWDSPPTRRQAGHPLGSADLARRTLRPPLTTRSERTDIMRKPYKTPRYIHVARNSLVTRDSEGGGHRDLMPTRRQTGGLIWKPSTP